MTMISMSLEKFMFGNEHWRSYRAVDEVDIYCDLLNVLQDRVDALETRGKDEEVTLRNVQAVLSSYAFEITLKSFWALDHPDDTVPPTHDVLKIFNGLDEQTVQALQRLNWTREPMRHCPTPFQTNRYSMETSTRNITIYPSRSLRQLTQLLRDRLDEPTDSKIRRLLWPDR